ncbi:MAG: RecQ family ATP-dependent DNA helicase, partial [Chloroflexota bacterium]|nr:RecQ family ATP-dependent DNA helicase [Chloroflexota bacterium]
AGKSLTFQLPALVLDGPVVVVSPLIALMHDQLTTLPEPLRSQSTLINSTLHPEEMDRRLYGIERGHYKLIYAAPERFRQQSFLGALRTAGVRLVVIDEAHCVSMWGHDFRPDYFFLTRALEELGDPPTLAVTATATNAMAQQISTSLGRTFSIVRTSAFRENLFYSVERFQKKEDKATRLVELCKETDGPTIVYVPSRKEADALAGQLRYHGVRAVPYHAGMASGQRTSNQNDFLTGSAQVIVATIAFGMGINKPNVRLIVHFAPSRSLEAYIQESGRAGRDGEPSKCVLLYTTGDTATIRRHAGESAVTIEALRTVYRIIRDNAAGRWSLLDRHELAQIADEQEIDVNVAIGLLEQAALIRRHPDCGRVLTLRWSQRSADSDNVAPNDRFGAWLNRVSSGSAIVTAPTATACAELDCSPSVLERAIASHHGIAATFQMPSVCLEMLPASEGKVDMVAMLDRLMAAQRERAEQMITYLTTTACRHVHLARHLGEKIQPCGTVCDRCTTSGSRSQPLRPRVREKRRDDPYFAALAQWRTEKARERVVPAFVIASDRLLDKLATERPTTRRALRNISGIGDIKDQEFGEELVELIRSVTASQN